MGFKGHPVCTTVTHFCYWIMKITVDQIEVWLSSNIALFTDTIKFEFYIIT